MRAESIAELLKKTEEGGYAAMLLTAVLPDPTGYGRIVRDKDGSVLSIVEHKDASEQLRKINEVNISVYCFKTSALFQYIDMLKPNNQNGEYYLTPIL